MLISNHLTIMYAIYFRRIKQLLKMNAELFMKINLASFAVKVKKPMQNFSNVLFVITRSNFMMSSNQSVD